MSDVFTVPVPGGDLEVHRWPADRAQAPVVLAAHGITANGVSWTGVAERLAGAVTLIAPDLRGRAGSAAVGAPYGIARHADDLIAVLDHVGVDRTVLAGHSMGAFVACVAAVRQPSRVTSLVLVDGGVTLPIPVGVSVDEALTAVIGPAMRRLSMTFASRQAYREYWQAHPALAEEWSPTVEAYIQHDLVGAEPALRSSCSLEAVRADGADLIADTEILDAVRRLPVPAILLWAGRGLQNETPGLYDAQRLAAAGLDPAMVRVEEVPDTNHYTLVVGASGAKAVAARLLAAVG